MFRENKNKANLKYLGLLIIAMVSLFLISRPVLASRLDELKLKIDDYNKQIADIEKEIEQYQKQINETGKETKTLKDKITQLEATITSLRKNISLTEKKIGTANLIIEQLDIGIQAKEKEINNSKEVIAEIVRKMDEQESQTLVEILLANSNFSEFFGNIERMNDLQNSININLQQLKALKSDFQNQKEGKETEKTKLKNFYSQLADQKSLVETQKIQQNSLLKETKNKEATYKKLLADALAKQQALENEISTYEEQIRIEIDPNSLPKTGSGVISWPVDKPIITQYFGNTPFATQNPQVYGGKGHDGLDLRASVGTPIKSSQAGVITAIGNTISFCRGSQIGYGKWVLIKHDNNLSTFYAHLSLIKVSPGDNMGRSQLIGYSGDTGYSTGPHLHFGVFATQAIASLEYTSTSPTCGGIIMHQPIVPPNGKLNPLSYL